MSGRPLTGGEWEALSGGLARALRQAGVTPRIEARAHAGAWIAAFWRGRPPVMAVGSVVWWPGAKADFADDAAMAVLQHELQHVLDYAQGRLSAAGYLLSPRHWTYQVALTHGLSWDDLGAEQRASLAERLWREERRDPGGREAEMLRAVIPWAR